MVQTVLRFVVSDGPTESVTNRIGGSASTDRYSGWPMLFLCFATSRAPYSRCIAAAGPAGGDFVVGGELLVLVDADSVSVQYLIRSKARVDSIAQLTPWVPGMLPGVPGYMTVAQVNPVGSASPLIRIGQPGTTDDEMDLGETEYKDRPALSLGHGHSMAESPDGGRLCTLTSRAACP